MFAPPCATLSTCAGGANIRVSAMESAEVFRFVAGFERFRFGQRAIRCGTHAGDGADQNGNGVAERAVDPAPGSVSLVRVGSNILLPGLFHRTWRRRRKFFGR